MRQTCLINDNVYWRLSKDGDPIALDIFSRHYSYKNTKRPNGQFVGPGQKMVLIGMQNDALFVWRKFISDDGQTGVNCSIFRNESQIQSSELILQAERIALREMDRTQIIHLREQPGNQKRKSWLLFQKGWLEKMWHDQNQQINHT